MTLVATLLIAQATPTYAGFGSWIKGAVEDVGDAVDDAADWTENAVDDAVDWTEGAVDDAADWTEGAVDDATSWTEGAIDDASNWTENAVDDAANWTEGAFDDATDWTEGAIYDASNWTEGALEDVGEVTLDGLEIVGEAAVTVAEGAVGLAKDAYNLIANIEVDFSVLKWDPLKGLPTLTINENEMTDLFSSENGMITGLHNVSDRALTATTYTRLKDELEKAGIPAYIVDFALENVAGVDGEDIGAELVKFLPLNIVYGDLLGGIVNEVINNESFREIDMFTEALVPSDRVDGFTFEYQIPVEKIQAIGNNLHVVVSGIEGGFRDKLKVNILKEDMNGVIQTFAADKRALNGNELAYEALILDAGTNVKNIYVQVVNDFVVPVDPSKDIAQGIQKGLNSLIEGRSPISNQAARDIEGILDDINLNELADNGDVGTIIADKIIGQIPVLGTLIQLGGINDYIAEGIRIIVNQAEVRSYAKLEDFHVYAAGYDSQASLETAVASATTAADMGEGHAYYDLYDFSDDNEWVETEGDGWETDGELTCSTTAHGNAFIDGKVYSNFVAEADMTLNSGGNAGLIFRTGEIEGTVNDYNGYMAGIGFDGSKGVAFIGRANHDWNNLHGSSVGIAPGGTYRLRVVATGPILELYVDGALAVRTVDETFTKGGMGFQVWNGDAEFENLTVAEYLPDNTLRYDFAYDMPQTNQLTENWQVREHDYSTQFKAASRKKSNEYMIIDEVGYENVLVSVDITPTKDDGKSGLLVRTTDFSGDVPNDGYYVGLEADKKGRGTVILYEVKEGGQLKIITSSDAEAEEDMPNAMTVKLENDSIIVMVNGEEVINTVSQHATEGFVGFATLNSSAYYDNLSIIDLGLRTKSISEESQLVENK